MTVALVTGAALGHAVEDTAEEVTARGGLLVLTGYVPATGGVTALALAPGFTRTEAITAALGPNPPGSDPVERPGRAVAALLQDAKVARHAGRTIPVAELAA